MASVRDWDRDSTTGFYTLYAKWTVNTYNVYYGADSFGYIVASSSVNQIVNYNEYSKMVIAKAIDGYRFLQWSDGNAQNPRKDLITDDLSVSAIFISVACPGQSFVTDFDGNEYDTVAIGSQCWLRSNLETTHYNNGVSIPEHNSNASSFQYTTGGARAKYGVWSNYGLLYNGYTLNHPICPTGWKVPAQSDFLTMFSFLDNLNLVCDDQPGYYAKALGKKHSEANVFTWNYSTDRCAISSDDSIYSDTTEQTLKALAQANAVRFDLLPVGYRNDDVSGTFYDRYNASYLWTSTQTSTQTGIYNYVFKIDNVNYTLQYKLPLSGVAIRCIKDD